MLKILFATSEAVPLIKTGGLADVCGSLPPALTALGADVRLLLPAYRDARNSTGPLKAVAQLPVPWISAGVTLLEGRLPGSPVTLWMVDYPPAYDRAGNPYLDERGQPWFDNAARFALLGFCAAALARGDAGISWRPDIVHCHDWQTGLIPALLAHEPNRPATVFTIHNVSYQGLYAPDALGAWRPPTRLWALDALEFHGQLSFIKGGIVFADRISTVSPTYAREIQTPEFGNGLDGLLRHRNAYLSGILNGIDDQIWNPARDAYLSHPYSSKDLSGKADNKRELQRAFGLSESPGAPLIGMVGRLVHQKGIDLILEAVPELEKLGLQLVILGNGERQYEQALRRAAANHPNWLRARVGFDEALAHRVEAGADIFLMPSRFEPCGLNQMYSLRYGTVPIVRRVGGLADTVVDATPDAVRDETATGIVFDGAGADTVGLLAAVGRALALYAVPHDWRRLALTGMRQDFSWRRRASDYMHLYELARRERDEAADRRDETGNSGRGQ